jgi:glycosyltransferase involved in cell wall biosynthesis/O-antigen/teichoic acid export membrane protein
MDGATLDRLHILVLTDRDWTHPQGGGTGTNLFGQVSRWLDWGHRVSIVACSYEGAEAREEIGDLTIHRVGGRSTVFPRAIWRQWRGLVPDADVVLEVVNGITFLTPLWLRTPRVTLVHHIHQRHYREEMGRFGAVAGVLLEKLPLSLLYRGSRFLTISNASAAEMAAHGLPRERIEVGYIGVEADAFAPGERAERPTLLFLGRLKGYKRIELLLEVAERLPEVALEIAGDGDHRPELEREIRERGLGDRVRLLGAVDEARKLELLQSAWVNMTASSAEGWCLTVMEAAACRTPSVALAVGGLPESVVDGETGLLADDVDGLVEQTARIVRDPGLRDRLGDAAHERAREFSWDRTAGQTLDLLESERREPSPSLRRRLSESDTLAAAGLAAAVMASNAIALMFTIVFARLLGASGYGSLAALLSTFLILTVPGTALQITDAREVSTAIALGHEAPGAGVRRWLGRIALMTVAVTAVAILLREQIAAAIGIDLAWAAAAVVPSGCLWLILSVQRGALQGIRRYRLVGTSIVGEATMRLALGVALFGVGLGVTGAFLGTAASVLTMSLALALPLRRLLPARAEAGPEPGIGSLLSVAWAPVAGLALIAVLQNVDVIVVKHQASDEAAGSYAAAAVAAKAIIWVAIGLGMYLLPEAARRTREGLDARPVLIRTLGLIAAVALPMFLVYVLAAEPLLGAVFGDDLTEAAGALPWLCLAMALLASAYLSVQYLLALHRASFLWVLGVAAVLEPVLLQGIGARLTDVAVVLFGLQLAVATVVLTLSFRSAAAARARGGLPA